MKEDPATTMQQNDATRLQAFLDREELFDLVRRERFARDQRRFEVMGACFHRDAYVRTSWYDGHGGAAYVDATRKWMGAKGTGKHWVFPAFAQIAGDRATVESPAMSFNRDVMKSVNPSEALPVDWERLARLRSSYKFLAYIQGTRGVKVNPDLLGDDRPDQLAAFHAAEDRWLAGND